MVIPRQAPAIAYNSPCMGRRSAKVSTAWILGASGLAAAVVIAILVYRVLRPAVDVTAVVEGPVVEAFYATGTVSAEREYSIRANTSGIVRVLVDKGSAVKKGDTIAIVDNAELRFDVDQAAAELKRKKLLADDKTSPVLNELRAKIQASNDLLEIALKDEKRVTGLIDRGATSQNDLDQSLNRVKAMWSDAESFKSQLEAKRIDLDKDVEVAKAALDSAQWNLDQATVYAPIDSTVLDWPISSGTRVAVNDHILQLADVTSAHLVMRAQVDEEDKNRLRPPTADDDAQIVKMTLYAYPNEVLSGRVDKVYDKADPDRRTYEVDVKFDRPDLRLAAGMTGELNFIVDQRQSVLIVPTQAIQGGSLMLVRDGHLKRPDIITGLKSIERTEIRSGVQQGDVVVISPILGLEDGQSVRTRWIDPIIAAGLNKPPDSDDTFKGFR
jgi:HlyD family secretion protein